MQFIFSLFRNMLLISDEILNQNKINYGILHKQTDISYFILFYANLSDVFLFYFYDF